MAKKKIIFCAYVVFFALYFVIGFLPSESAEGYEVSADLDIPAINLDTVVTNLKPTDHKLLTPEKIVGSYSKSQNKTLLIGHSTTIFQNLNKISIDDEIFYENKTYKVTNIDILARENIDMNKIMMPENKDTIILMTCAGEIGKNGDASHRLIVVAKELQDEQNA